MPLWIAAIVLLIGIVWEVRAKRVATIPFVFGIFLLGRALAPPELVGWYIIAVWTAIGIADAISTHLVIFSYGRGVEYEDNPIARKLMRALGAKWWWVPSVLLVPVFAVLIDGLMGLSVGFVSAHTYVVGHNIRQVLKAKRMSTQASERRE